MLNMEPLADITATLLFDFLEVRHVVLFKIVSPVAFILNKDGFKAALLNTHRKSTQINIIIIIRFVGLQLIFIEV